MRPIGHITPLCDALSQRWTADLPAAAEPAGPGQGLEREYPGVYADSGAGFIPSGALNRPGRRGSQSGKHRPQVGGDMPPDGAFHAVRVGLTAGRNQRTLLLGGGEA
jgi:hypothetical protein